MLLKNFVCLVGVPAFLLLACQQHQQAQPQPEMPAEEGQEAELAEKTPPKPRIRVAPRPAPKAPVRQAAPAETADAAPSPEVAQPAAPFVPKAIGKRVARVDVPGKYVALTFDDGPNPATTPKILDILRMHGAHATFFVAGENAVNNKKILARATAEGHEIGAHTYSHIRLTGSSDEKIDREMSRTNAIIEESTGRKPVLMRPPYGATNARLVNKMYDDYGMTSVLWDVDTRDWQHPGVATVVRRAVGNARPGSIILVHDIHASTLAAVDDIVTGLQARGFKLVTVSQLMALGSTPVAAPQEEPSTEEPGAATPLPAPVETPAEPAVENPVPADAGAGGATPGSASISIDSQQD